MSELVSVSSSLFPSISTRTRQFTRRGAAVAAEAKRVHGPDTTLSSTSTTTTPEGTYPSSSSGGSGVVVHAKTSDLLTSTSDISTPQKIFTAAATVENKLGPCTTSIAPADDTPPLTLTTITTITSSNTVSVKPSPARSSSSSHSSRSNKRHLHLNLNLPHQKDQVRSSSTATSNSVTTTLPGIELDSLLESTDGGGEGESSILSGLSPLEAERERIIAQNKNFLSSLELSEIQMTLQNGRSRRLSTPKEKRKREREEGEVDEEGAWAPRTRGRSRRIAEKVASGEIPATFALEQFPTTRKSRIASIPLGSVSESRILGNISMNPNRNPNPNPNPNHYPNHLEQCTSNNQENFDQKEKITSVPSSTAVQTTTPKDSQNQLFCTFLLSLEVPAAWKDYHHNEGKGSLAGARGDSVGGSKELTSTELEAIYSRLALNSRDVAKVVPERIYSAAFHPTRDRVLVACGDKMGNIGFFSPDQPIGREHVHVYRPYRHPVSCLLFPKHDLTRLYSCSYDGVMRIMDIQQEVFLDVYATKSWEEEVTLTSIACPKTDTQSSHSVIVS